MRAKLRLSLILTSMVLGGCVSPALSVITPDMGNTSNLPVSTATLHAPSPTAPSEPTQDGIESPLIQTTPEVTLTVNADPFTGLRIDDLAARSYGGPGIILGDIVKVGEGFTRFEMLYFSDGLRITGLANMPVGEGPFPTIIVNHGYLRPVDYQPGLDSWRIADWLAERGYIALMPDYRNYGGSDTGPNPFHIGYAIDIMNLVAQVESLPRTAPGQIGLIGHSMGGEASQWPMVLSHEIDAIVLYSAMSGDVGLNWAYARRHWPAQRDAMNALALIYGTPEQNLEGYAEISPINYLERVRMPVMIHHGRLDNVVPYQWSEDLNNRLVDAGADVTFWPYAGAGHTLIGQEFETLMQRSLEFFDINVRSDVNSAQ
jgi:uncharacterized protein